MNPQKLNQLRRELLEGAVPDCLPNELDEIVLDIEQQLRISGVPTREEVTRALEALNDGRFFAPSRKLAEAWSVHRGFDAVIEKRHIQSMIELGDLDDAEQRLTKAVTQVSGSQRQQAKKELGEYQGQQGRIAKQRFILNEDLDELAKSIEIYATKYREPGRSYFHGVNVVALVAAQSRLGVNVEMAQDIRLPELAETILADVKKKMAEGGESEWLLATASEACLALQRCDEAELWLHRFLQHPGTHPFHIESYSRQLRDIWGANALRNSTCADGLSRVIDRHVMRTQKRWSVSPEMLKTATSDPESLERNFSGERTFTINMIKRMVEKCAGIGCVTDQTGRRLGTGFLVQADILGFGSGDELVFVTNSHVISDSVEGAVSPAQAWVTFELECAARGEPVLHKVSAEVLFTSPPGEPGIAAVDHLDVTVVKLDTWPDGGVALRTNDSLPTVARKTRVFVVGHPSGDALQLSLHDSELLDVCDKELLLHYRTPTEKGSSGSPVFNMNWEVVALHHAGSSAMPRLRGAGHYEANEGITMRAIRQAASQHHR